jgi:hypothetical protein
MIHGPGKMDKGAAGEGGKREKFVERQKTRRKSEGKGRGEEGEE